MIYDIGGEVFAVYIFADAQVVDHFVAFPYSIDDILFPASFVIFLSISLGKLSWSTLTCSAHLISKVKSLLLWYEGDNLSQNLNHRLVQALVDD